jgi:hypothetical protein
MRLVNQTPVPCPSCCRQLWFAQIFTMISLVVLTVFVFKRHLLVRARPGLAALMGTCAALHMLVVGERPLLA